MRIGRRLLARVAVILLPLILCHPVPAQVNRPDDGVWVLVDTREGTLSVMRAERVVRQFDNIAIGRRGAALHRLRGDDMTPLGKFRVAWIERDSRFHRFFGLDYPQQSHALWGLRTGAVDAQTYVAIYRAHRNRRVPPQDTALGGYIGIHGLGEGDPAVHESFHWTNGCVALTNQQIDELELWISKGTEVIIR